MKRELVIALAVLAVVLLASRPATPWEFDELLFFQGVQSYDPVAHHPPPPGYPLFIGAGQLVRMVIPDDFRALVVISIVSSLAAFVLLALAFGRLAGSSTAGMAGAILFYFSPVMLVVGPLPMSDPGALALLAAALWFGSRGSAGRFAAFAALAVGWRIQFCIFVVPLLLVQVLLMRRWRERLIALSVFTIVCLAWLTPLAIAVGGPEKLIAFETRQAGYLAEHDADMSRSGWTPAMVAFRFIAHPWGTKLTSFPLLLIAATGAGVLARRREKAVLPIAVAGAAYLAVALWIMDPADGVRYALPSVLAVAFAAGAGVSALAARLRNAAPDSRPVKTLVYGAVTLFAMGSLVYTSPILSQRKAGSSPPVEAARYARQAFPPNAVTLYELPLWPHAQYFFGDRRIMRVNEGLAAYVDRPDVPLFIYADGATSAPGARTFRWAPSDAYSKLTRNHYRVVSILPVPPERRFRVLRGVNATEREPDGDEWRWLSSPAELQLPSGSARTAILTLGLPVIYPAETNVLEVSIDGKPARTVRLTRGRREEVSIEVPAGAPVLRFTAARAFVPAELPGSLNRDPRRLAVKLYDLRTEH